MASETGNAADVFLLLGEDESDSDTTPAGPAGPTHPVDVARVLAGRVEVDDMRDLGEVEAAGGDVGRYERRRLTRAESA